MKKKTGAVLVAGGGIAGMQASVDLAESGYKVWLVEREPAIGGRMVEIDKTFPTGDCAMCTIAPRLVECAGHNNIELITSADIEKIEGEAGRFTAHIKKRPSYVDKIKCNACGDCEKACPVETANAFDCGLSKRKAIYKLYPQAIPNLYAIDKQGVSPCRLACPAGVNAHGYIALIRAGKYKEALALIRQAMPFAASCGRICTHPCQSECARKDIDESIAICSLKRFAADMDFDDGPSSDAHGLKNNAIRNTHHAILKVAVVGSGPAGLTCAYHLAKMGYSPEVFEALPAAGGMLRSAIPDFRLPKEALERDIEFIKSAGVKIKTGVEVGKDISFDGLRKDYKAVFIATGAPKGRSLNIPGEQLKGVEQGINLLTGVKFGKEVTVGKRVAVIGGGSTAIDAAMTALRLGAEKVTILYRRTAQEMPASYEEIEHALREGIEIKYLCAPAGIEGTEGAVSGVKCVRMKLGLPDESGRRRPLPVEDSEFVFAADTVIAAIGQYTDADFPLQADPDTLATPLPGVFAGGDAVTGPDVFINAAAAGRKAAVSIGRYLKGEKPAPVTLAPSGKKAEKKLPAKTQKTQRIKMPKQPVEERVRTWTEVELGFTEEQARQEASRCLDCGVCCECGECVKVCAPEAINHNETEEGIKLEVGAAVFSCGFTPFDAGQKKAYGYGRYKDVVTSVEYERILSAFGPYAGHIKRPSDGRTPEKIAFIHCVGSRDKTVGKEYCSAVCCMYTAKEAMVTREHLPSADITAFFIDMRAHGKGFERYWNRAKKDYGIKYNRCMVSKIRRIAKTKRLQISFMGEAGIERQEFDLVVLAVGLAGPAGADALKERLGIEFSQDGFCSTDIFTPISASRPGIFAAGAFRGPRDISESVIDASAAAAEAGAILSSARGQLTAEKKYPGEKDVSAEKERIGVFVCCCGRNIASVVDVEKVAESVKGAAGVAYTEINLFTCSPDGLERIRKAIDEHKLNRVVVASCSPRTHEALFQKNLREAGLNPYLFTMANIRDQCSWVHSSKPAEATVKAEGLTRMAAAKARNLTALKTQVFPVTQSALVIGGGISGMTAAVSIAEQGYEAFLVERQKELGGNARHIYGLLDGSDMQGWLKGLIDRVTQNRLIRVYAESEIEQVSGFAGNFKTKICGASGADGRNIELSHGVIIVATGAAQYEPAEYLYGLNDRVITQRELEEGIFANHSPLTTHHSPCIVMIQCVGSRDEKRPYCSRICCATAVKNALKLKGLNPQADIFILYRDIRTYGALEHYYNKARDAGITFIRYDEDNKPEVKKAQGALRVEVKDASLDMMPVAINADCVVLSAGIIPEGSNERLSSLLKAPLTEDKFFLEAHVKLRPVDFAAEGIFLCGMAHSPKLIDENIAQAKAACARAVTIISKKQLQAPGIAAVVDEDKCASCLTCLRVCPYNVPAMNKDGIAEIEAVRCHGCGICAGECPAKAIQLAQFKDEQILPEIKAGAGQAV